jgi:hypothetical protein
MRRLSPENEPSSSSNTYLTGPFGPFFAKLNKVKSIGFLEFREPGEERLMECQGN